MRIEGTGQYGYKLNNFTQNIEYKAKMNKFYVITDKSVYRANEKGYFFIFKYDWHKL